MVSKEIIEEIKKLPVSKRILIIEHTLKSIRESETREKMLKAVDSMFEDYRNDKELTAFSQLDYEAFYEAR